MQLVKYTGKRSGNSRRGVRKSTAVVVAPPQSLSNNTERSVPFPAIPTLNSGIALYAHTLQFKATSANTTQILAKNLLDAICLASASNAAYELFDSFRLRKVEVWFDGLSSAPYSASVVFDGATYSSSGDMRIHSAVNVGNQPLYIRAVPSKKSPLCLWHGYDSAVVFTLAVPVNSLIRVTLDYRMDSNQLPQAVQRVLIGATPGQVYFRGLDGYDPASSSYPPFGDILAG